MTNKLFSVCIDNTFAQERRSAATCSYLLELTFLALIDISAKPEGQIP